MTKTVVIALDNILRRSKNTQQFVEFFNLSFKDKLNTTIKLIREACEQRQQFESLNPEAVAEEWVVCWREYTIMHHTKVMVNDRYKSLLKSELRKVKADYPKLTIVSGPICTYKLISKPADIKQKIAELTKLYDKMPVALRAELQPPPDMHPLPFLLLRNISYIFPKNGSVKKHANIILSKNIAGELEALKGSFPGPVIFWPGQRWSEADYFATDNIAPETCLEHAKGYYARYTRKESARLIQLIMSCSITFDPTMRRSPCVVHVDSIEETRLITDVNAKNLAVELYTLDMLEAKPVLKAVKPEIMPLPAEICAIPIQLSTTEEKTAPTKLITSMEDNREADLSIKKKPTNPLAQPAVVDADTFELDETAFAESVSLGQKPQTQTQPQVTQTGLSFTFFQDAYPKSAATHSSSLRPS